MQLRSQIRYTNTNRIVANTLHRETATKSQNNTDSIVEQWPNIINTNSGIMKENITGNIKHNVTYLICEIIRRSTSFCSERDSTHVWSSPISTSVTSLTSSCLVGSWFFMPSSEMSRDVTKPTKRVCAQRRLRSAWAFAQSDQILRCPHEESLGP